MIRANTVSPGDVPAILLCRHTLSSEAAFTEAASVVYILELSRRRFGAHRAILNDRQPPFIVTLQAEEFATDISQIAKRFHCRTREQAVAAYIAEHSSRAIPHSRVRVPERLGLNLAAWAIAKAVAQANGKQFIDD